MAESGESSHARMVWAVVAVALLAGPRQAYAQGEKSVEFQGRRWVADSVSSISLAEFKGRPALSARGGVHTWVFLPEVDFRDGTIEVDLAAGPRGIPGIGFRGSDDAERVDRVTFTSSPSASSTAESRVEQAVITRRNGTLLVLRMARREKPRGWFHVKLVVVGSKVAVYVDGSKEPVLVVDKMLDKKGHGHVGVWGLHDVYFTNFRCTPAE